MLHLAIYEHQITSGREWSGLGSHQIVNVNFRINLPLNTQFVLTLLPRYFVNDSFYEEGGPAFLMIGGEGTASPRWMVQGKVYISGQ